VERQATPAPAPLSTWLLLVGRTRAVVLVVQLAGRRHTQVERVEARPDRHRAALARGHPRGRDDIEQVQVV